MARNGTWIVTASGERPVEEVAKEVADAGLEVRDVLTEIGIIVAHGDEDAATRARAVQGVADVSPDHQASI